MSSVDPRVLEMRRAFDGTFAEPPPPAGQAGEALLALQIAGDPYAVRMAQLGGLARDRSVVPVPGSDAGFCGLSCWRGLLLPVWNLAALLGYATSPGSAAWQIVAAGEPVWALNFESFSGYLTVSADALLPYAGQGPAASFATQVLLEPGGLRPVLELALLKEMIQSKNLSSPKRSNL